MVVVALQEDNTTLKRRNSVPSAIILPPLKPDRPPPTPAADYELLLFKSPSSASAADAYTSLKDIIPFSPSSILSPTPAVAIAGISSSSCGSGYEISIRNRLVKQAAWAYLQPAVLSSPSSSSRWICFSGEFLRPMISQFRRVLSETFTRVYDWLVDALWLILCR